jgi:hypothetical protein
MVASADFIVPLIAALFLDAASSTSKKSCFLCFSDEEYKTKVIREIETRGQEVIDMVKMQQKRRSIL